MQTKTLEMQETQTLVADVAEVSPDETDCANVASTDTYKNKPSRRSTDSKLSGSTLTQQTCSLPSTDTSGWRLSSHRDPRTGYATTFSHLPVSIAE